MTDNAPAEQSRQAILNYAYMSGACHIHALAAQSLHGGHFAALLDYGDPFGVDDDECDIPSVWHVWSVHETPEGLVARDVTGDLPVSRLKERVLQLWPEVEEDMSWGEIQIDEKRCLAELECLIDAEGEGDRPLATVEAEDLVDAIKDTSVAATPGTRPAIQIAEPHFEETGAGLEP